MGLLGTVLGMIRAFLEINTGNVEVVRQMKLAGGVAEALVTTASGLSIGILAMIFYSVFRGRVQRYLSELEAAAKADEKIAAQLEGKQIIKTIVVPGRLVNFVVK